MHFTIRYLRTHFKRLIRVGRARNRVNRVAITLLGCWALLSGLGHAQGSIRVATPPVEYVPFEVVVQTSKNYCYDPMFPILGEVQYGSGTLSVVLTHLPSSLVSDVLTTCGQERKFVLPGLPRGLQTIKVDVTDLGVSSNGGPGARVSETITSSIDVTPFGATTSLVNFWTGGFMSTSPTDNVRVFQLTQNRGAMFVGQWDWLEVGAAETGYTFKAISISAGDQLPNALTPLYVLAYPAPYRGVFWTINRADAQRLANEWGRALSVPQWAVGRLINGACPIGMSPVYQTFHLAAITHRWTQSRAAYAVLLANGYQGEGPAWCAPALRGE